MDQRLYRAFVPGASAAGRQCAGAACHHDPAGGLAGRGTDHWLAVPVLQRGAQGSGVCQPEEEHQDQQGEYPRSHSAVHPGLDCPIHGGKQPWPPMGGRASERSLESRLEILSGRGRTGTGGTGAASGHPQRICADEAGRHSLHRSLRRQWAYIGLSL